MSVITDNDKEGLTEEELAAINDDEEVNVIEEESNELSEDDKVGDDNSDGGESGEVANSDDDNANNDDADIGGEDAKGADADVNADAGTDDNNAQDAEEASKAPDFTPKLNTSKPEDVDAQITSIDEQIKAVGDELTEGDLELNEYHDKLAALNNQRSDLNILKKQAEFAEQSNADIAEQRWTWEQDQFFNTNSHYKASSAKYAAFGQIVADVLSNGEFANKDGLSVLSEADKRYKAEFAAPSLKDGDIIDNGEPIKPNKDKKVVEIPKTLGGLPAADTSGVDSGGEFAAIDKLEGMELEEAISRMSPDQAERYAAG